MRSPANKSCLSCVVFILLAACVTANGKVIYVDADATGANDGACWADAYKYLQDALADANPAEKPIEIRVAQGIYKPDQGNKQSPGDWEATFQLKNGVAIKGGYAGLGAPDPNARDFAKYESVLSGDLAANDVDVGDPHDLLDEPSRSENTLSVVTCFKTDETAVLDSFTITGGQMSAIDGAGSVGGGGMVNYSARSIVRNCIFVANAALDSGGGILCAGGSNPTIVNCVFKENYAGYGGGMDGGSPTLINCTFSGNSAYAGGALWGCHGLVKNCTFIRNSAHYGGVLFGIGKVRNCVIWRNTPDQIWSADAVSYSDIEGGWPGDGNIDADPQITDINDGDYHLKSQSGRWDPEKQSWVKDDVTSPCIDAGDPMSPVGLEPFPNGGRINMGAYGGTPEASKSYFDEPVCETIVAGDINGDCKVDFADLAIIALHWLEDNTPRRVTKTYVLWPDLNALVVSGGFVGQVHETYSVRGRFDLTVDSNAGTAWFS